MQCVSHLHFFRSLIAQFIRFLSTTRTRRALESVEKEVFQHAESDALLLLYVLRPTPISTIYIYIYI